MNVKLQCQTCQGVYYDVSTDGVSYFHACPPISAAELPALDPGGTLQLRVGGERPLARDERLTVDQHGVKIGVVKNGKGASTPL